MLVELRELRLRHPHAHPPGRGYKNASNPLDVFCRNFLCSLYTGSHQRIAVFGALAEDGSQMFRSYGTANSDTFMDFARQLKARFGKVAIIMDRAPWHASKKTELMMREEKIIPVFLPTGSPYLNAVEACWQRAKRHLLVSEYYPTFGQMKEAVSDFFRTTRFGLDIMKHLYRTPPVAENL